MLLSVMFIGVEHPAQLPVPVVLDRRRMTLYA
jgi:hypothetical protein